jgi:hypothetical protein
VGPANITRRARSITQSDTSYEIGSSLKKYTRAAEITEPTLLRKQYDYAHGNQFGSRDNLAFAAATTNIMPYWMGRIPKDEGWDSVRRLAVQDDVVGKCLDRIVNAILGKDPEWTYSETTPEALQNEVNEPLADWHKKKKLHREMKKFARTLQWAGKAILRVFVPIEQSSNDGQLLTNSSNTAPQTLANVLNTIIPQALGPHQAGAIHDAWGRVLGYWFVTQREIFKPELNKIELEDIVEIHAPDETQVFRMKGIDDYEPLGQPEKNALFNPDDPENSFLFAEYSRDGGSAITQTVIDFQNALNVASTYMRRNSEQAGFRTMAIANADTPVDADGNDAVWKNGPDVILDLKGIATKGSENNPEAVATPSVTVIEPVDPRANLLPEMEHWESKLLGEFDQEWTQRTTNAAESADGQRLRRSSFDQGIMMEVGVIAEAFTFTLEKALQIAGAVMGAQFDAEIMPKLYVDVVSGNLEQFKVLLEGYKVNVVSLESLIKNNPAVQDVDEELALITKQKAEAEAKAQAELAAQAKIAAQTNQPTAL